MPQEAHSDRQGDISQHATHEPLFPPAPPWEPKKTIATLLDIVWRGKWMILAVLLLAMGVAAWQIKNLPPPSYIAQTLLLIETEGPQNEALSSGYLDGGSLGDRNLANQIVVIQQSLAIAERVAQRLIDLEQVPKTGQRISVLGAPGETLTARELALRVQPMITVTQASEETDAIWISAMGSDPEESVLLANTYAEEYVKYAQTASRQRISGSAMFLQGQVAERQHELRGLEEQIEKLGRSGAVALDAETQRSLAQVAQLEAGIDDARIEQSTHEAKLKSIEQELEQVHPKLVTRMSSGLEKEIDLTLQKIAELEVRLAEINVENPDLQGRGDASNDLTLLNSKIDQMKEHVRELSVQDANEIMASGGIEPTGSGKSYVAELNRSLVDERVAVSGLKAKIQSMGNRLASYMQKLQTIPEQSMQLARLERAHDARQKMFLAVLDKLDEARMAEASEIGLARILRPALFATPLTGPSAYQILLMASLLGLLVAFGAATLRHKLDTRMYTPDDLRNRGTRILSVVPDMKPMIKELQRIGSAGKGTRVSTALVSSLLPHSPCSEAFRRLYISIQLNRPDAVVQTILITSSEEGAGKSTTALNLAITAANTGRRTLVIDADLRRPSLHQHLSSSHSGGLRELLQQPRVDLDQEQFATPIDNLYFLSAGGPAPNPTALLASQDMRSLISWMRDRFDLIVFDSPPVLVATDAVLLSTQMDATVVVVSSGGTDNEAHRQTLEELYDAGAVVSGAILNRFDPTYVYGYGSTHKYRLNRYRYLPA